MDIFYIVPDKSKDGGIAMYFKESIFYSIRQDLQLSTLGDGKFENLWIKLVKDKTKYLVEGIYRHPNHDFEIC